MAVHSSTLLSNGHLLTVTSYFPAGVFRVEERNECGTMLHVAFTSREQAEADAWCRRAQERGYGLRPTIGGPSCDCDDPTTMVEIRDECEVHGAVVRDPAAWRRVALAGRRYA